MHGIQHLYRQHAVEKQISTESWHSAQSQIASQAHLQHNYPQLSMRLNSVESGSSDTSSASKSSHWSQDKVLDKLASSSSPQPVPDSTKSISNHYRNSPTTMFHRGSCDSSYGSIRRTPSSKQNFYMDRSISPKVKYQNSTRRASADSYGNGTPPLQSGYFPHDLDDIYENNSDYQYYTHTGAYTSRSIDRPSINSIFHRTHAAHSLDEYSSHWNYPNKYSLDGERPGFRNRFDNSSFIKGLSGSEDGSPREGKTKNSSNHHHSIQEMFKHLGKKVHMWSKKIKRLNKCITPE